MSFLPENYQVPAASGNYMKFVQGDNKFRILSQPIIGWETWKEYEDGSRKPIRTPVSKPFTQDDTDDPTTIKHFWAMVVWNYKEEKVQILEITQKGIQKSLQALSVDPDWGSPVLTYDITVNKTGEKMETEYQTHPSPPKKIDPGIVKMYEDMDIRLEALFESADPFAKQEK